MEEWEEYISNHAEIAVNEESITIIKPDGYLESVPFYKVVKKDN